jgi:YfiH family protein
MVYSPDDGENPTRLALFRSFGLEIGQVLALKQVHSRDVVAAERSSMPFGAEADGMICMDRGIALSVTVADCLPVFLYDAESGARGLLHSGWKGTGIVIKALELMKEKWGTSPGAVAAVLGPCIKSCCYKVDEERAKTFTAEFGNISSNSNNPLGPAVIEKNGKTGKEFFLDLQAANIALLSEAEVRDISVCNNCTFTDERLGSFRREGAGYTRMAALLGYF